MQLVRLSCLAVLAGALTAQAAPEPIRVLLRARNGGADRLTSLRYIGGFETKTLLYETLVRRGTDGRIEPGLATRWWWDEARTTCLFELREGATFHDGKPVTAEAVRVHFQRWFGLPEHDWLAVNRRIAGVTTSGDRIVRVHLTEPYALLDDLCVINPCAIVGPGARDWEGEFQRPMGSGPFRFVQALDDGKRWRLQRVAEGGALLDIAYLPRGRDRAPVDALLAGTADVFVGGWDEDLPAEALAELAADPRFVVQEAPGSSVAYVSFRLEGPTADPAIRRRIQAAVDRAELIAKVEGGRADATTAWAAASVRFWPRGVAPSEKPAPVAAGTLPTLKIAGGATGSRGARIAAVLKEQLERAGFAVELSQRAPRGRDVAAAPAVPAPAPAAGTNVGTVRPLDAESGENRRVRNREERAAADVADLRIQITHGVPYDPHQALVARFGPVPAKNADQPRPRGGVDPRLQALVAVAMATADETVRLPIYAEIQALLDSEALIVPLYAPRRVALRRADIDGIVLPIDVYRVDLAGVHRQAR
jgi:ABC-type transport system substrate-binding protein